METNKIPDFLRLAMLATAESIIASRKPDVIIGTEEDPYVLRWWLGPHGKEPSAYVHVFLRSDYDGALHDHRYKNVSIILRGNCMEHFHMDGVGKNLATYSLSRNEGDVVERAATIAHRIELIDDMPMTTIFFTGKHERDWGFHTADGWMGWREHDALNKDVRPGGNYAAKGGI